MSDIKFFIGPMSKNIVDSIINFCNYNNKIGLIPSRRQIDYNGGYVGWNTKEFIYYVRSKTNNVIIERDHSGIGQGEIFDTGSASQSHDALNKMDIIHVDPWKIYAKYNDGMLDTVENIKFINSVNPNCLYEVGTEQSIRKFEVDEFEKLLTDLQKNLGNLFNKIKYAVVQSGTELKGTKNIGIFEPKRLEKMVKVCNQFGLLSKEHNGDYLSKEEIKKRFDIGLSAINIAPEFGVFETDIILENMSYQQKEKFFDMCYRSNKWLKWVDNDFNPFENKIELIRICGHYQFNTEDFKEMNLDLDNIIKEKLYNKLKIMSEL